MERVKTLSEEEIDLVINTLKNTNEDFDTIIYKLEHYKKHLRKTGKGRQLTDRARTMSRIYSRLKYYASKKTRTEYDEIKLNRYINQFNETSLTKKVRVDGNNIIYEEK